jgi:hypothetical protein
MLTLSLMRTHLHRTVALMAMAVVALAATPEAIRPPAVPLVVHDPYFSIWSVQDRLTEGPSKHWTGAEQPLTGLARIDGTAYRFTGDRPRTVPALNQTGFDLTPTRSIYRFEGGGVRLDFTFFTPALPADLDVLSRPATYLIWDARSADGRSHNVSIYFDASARIAVNTPDQRVACSRMHAGDIEAVRAGTVDQQVLAKSGDNLRIDWGYMYLTAPAGTAELRASSPRAARMFAENGGLPEADELDQTALYSNDLPVLAARLDFGSVGASPVSRLAVLAYDDVFSIDYFHRRLRPYWRRGGMDAAGLLRAAVHDFPGLLARAKVFDEELTSDLIRSGGPKYAALAITAYRQTLAAHKLVADLDGRPLYFSKENFSNGSIDTVDVTYPSSPFFLFLNPRLLEAQLVPVLEYSEMPRWRWPYAPHDLGRYPLADGQQYGGAETSEENQMPVEESGNMLIMVAALAKAEGNADVAQKHWPLLSKWAEYLREKGLDPENQLCTDDFAGHLAHNTNLSLKAILALRSYADLASTLGHKDEGERYLALSKDMAAKWVAMAADGDHYRLAFDKPGTWSQKYNLVWDKILGYGLFPSTVAQKEVAFYETKRNAFGLPLDNRAAYTKLDWLIWTATLAGDRSGFESLADAGYRFANETPTRVPLSDWYSTTDGKQVGFQARSVVGGVFMKMLDDPATWKKWAASPK